MFEQRNKAWAFGVRAVAATAMLAAGLGTIVVTTATTASAVGTVVSSTTVTSASNPSVAGQSLVYTATVTGTVPGGEPTGTVTFSDADGSIGQFCSTSTVASSTQDTATYSCTEPAVDMTAAANHPVTAGFSGDSTYAASTSTSLSQVVNADTTTTTLGSSLSTGSTVGIPVTYTATVVAGGGVTALSPAGTVTFTDTFLPTGPQQTLCAAVNLGAGSAGSATATCVEPSADMTLGTHTVTAVFTPAGGGNFSTSTSSTLSQVVSAGNSTTTVTITPTSPSAAGTGLTLSAVVAVAGDSGIAPTGAVTFSDSVGGLICTNPAPDTSTAGTATYSCIEAGTRATAGSHAMTVSYAGDGNFNPSTGTPTQTITSLATTTTVTASASPSTAGQAVVYTATVKAPAGETNLSPVGTITFSDATGSLGQICSTNTPASSSGGITAYQCSEPAADTTTGSHAITTSFTPSNGNFTGSTGSLAQTIASDTSTTVVISPGSSGNTGSSAGGSPITYTAVVTAGTPGGSFAPNGTVTFSDGATVLCTAVATSALTQNSVSAGCTETGPQATTGAHSITATYTPPGTGANFAASSNAASAFVQTMTAGPLSIAWTSATSGTAIDTPVTFTVQIQNGGSTDATPTGTVTFADGGSPICTAVALVAASPYPTASCTENGSLMTGGTHVITVTSNGDVWYAPTSITEDYAVNSTAASSSLALITSDTPSFPGVPVTFTATVTGSSLFAPAGTVSFTSNSPVANTQLCSAVSPSSTSGAVSSYTCTVQGTQLPAGTQAVSAAFSGDINYATSSNSVSQVVERAATTVVISASTDPSSAGQALTYVATIHPSDGALLTPTGTVTFYDGAGAIAGCSASATVPGAGDTATATCIVPPAALGAGVHPIAGVYSGDTNYIGSDNLDGAFDESITTGAVSVAATTNWATFTNPVVGTPIDVATTVTAPGSLFAPTGTVTFVSVQGSSRFTLCTATLTATGQANVDQASCAGVTSPYFDANPSTVEADYNGDTNFATANGTTTPLVFQAATQNGISTTVTASLSSPGATGQASSSPEDIPVTYTVTLADPATGGLVAPTGTVSCAISNSTPTVIDTIAATGPTTTKGSSVYTCTVPASDYATPGTYTANFSYVSGDGNYDSVPALGTWTQTVLAPDDTIALATTLPTGTVQNVQTNLTLTATISSTTAGDFTQGADGDIVFFMNGEPVTGCTDLPVNQGSPSSSGTATCTPTGGLPAGVDAYTANYFDDSGVTGFGSAASNAETYNAAYYPTVTSVTTTPQAPIAGQTVTLDATVNPTSGFSTLPSGTLLFTVNGKSISCVTPAVLSGTLPDTATCQDAAGMPGGPDVVQASFPTDGVYSPSVGSLSVTAATAPSAVSSFTVEAASSPTDPPISGQSLRFDITVQAQPANSFAPTGTVAITTPGVNQNLCTVTLTAGSGTCFDTAVQVPAGNLQFNAAYSGDSNFSTSANTTVEAIVAEKIVDTSLVANPSPVVFGQPITFTVGLTPQIVGTEATGTVTITAPSSSVLTGTLCTISLTETSKSSGSCTLSTWPSSPPFTGAVSFTATYSGDQNFTAGATGQVNVFVQDTPTLNIVVNPQNPVYGQYPTFNLAIASPSSSVTPTGTVSVTSSATGATVLCTYTLGSASPCTSGVLIAAQNNVTFSATYSGDSHFVPVTGTAVANVERATTATAITATATGYGQTQTYTATVSPQFTGTTPTGSVKVTAQGVSQPLCTITLIAGAGQCSSSTLVPAGASVVYSGIYSGDPNFLTSTGTVEQTVSKIGTTTSLTVTPTVVYGSEQTGTASVTVASTTSGTPTGTVTVVQGTTALCTFTLVNGAGSCALGAIQYPASATAYSLVATYNGDTNFNLSASSGQPLTVNKAARASATVTVSVAPASVAYGNEDSVVYATSVTSPETPTTGLVNITSGATTLCTVTLANGTGTCSPTARNATLAVGTSTITATYGGDTNVTGLATGLTTLTVAAAASTATLVVAGSPAAYGSETGVTVTGTAASTTTGTPAGTGTITNLTTGQTLISGALNGSGQISVTLTASQLATGTYSLSFAYAGGVLYGGSSSAPQPVTITGAAAPTVSLIAITPVAYGAEGTAAPTVTVSGPAGTPTGTVTVTTGATILCTITLAAGAGTCAPGSTVLPASGVAYPLVATYHGDPNFPAATGTATLTVNQAAAPSVGVSFTNPTVAYGAEGTADPLVTVTSSAGEPTGTVSLSQGATALCTINLTPGTTSSTGTCALPASALSAGSYSTATSNPIVATYNGDTDYPTATGTAALTVVRATTSNVALSINPTTVVYGAEGTASFAATVTGPPGTTATGTATITNGTTILCTVTLVAGTGTCSTTNLSVLRASSVAYPITATYNGNGNLPVSTSTAQSLTVTPAPAPSITLSATSPVAYGAEGIAAPTVTVTSAAGTPTGTATITSGSTFICTVALILGGGSCTPGPTTLAANAVAYPLVATYNGDSNYPAGATGTTNLVVNRAAASTAVVTVSATPASVAFGNEDAAVYTTTVTSPEAPTAGTVTITAGATTLCTVTLSNGTGACSPTAGNTALSIGASTITATYQGDPNVTGGSTATTTLTVADTGSTAILAVTGAPAAYGNETGITVTGTATSTTTGTPAGVGTITNLTTGQTVTTGTLNGSGQLAATLSASQLPAGTYTLSFTYNGTATYAGSTSAPQPLIITAATAPTVTLTATTPVAYGAEGSAAPTVTVTSPAGTPSGTVTITAGVATLCRVTLASGGGTCTPARTALPASGTAYPLVATYNGDTNYPAGATGTTNLAVNPAAASTAVVALSVAPANVAYGNEDAAVYTATVTSPEATPGGTITITSSGLNPTVLCTVTTLVAGTGTCSPGSSDIALPVGPATITATYNGDANVAGSTTGTATLTVARATATVTLSLSQPTLTYGNEQPVTPLVTATVTSNTSGTPGGTVTVSSLGVPVCVVTLSGGTGSCDPTSATALAVGSYPLVGDYVDTLPASFVSATSPTVAFTVVAASTTTALVVTGSPAAYGGESAADLSVTVTSGSSGPPAGPVQIELAGGAILCTVTLTADTSTASTGSCAAGAIQLGVGHYPLTAVYGGDANHLGSADSSQSLDITQTAAPTISVIFPNPSVAFGAEGTDSPTVTVTGPVGTVPPGTVALSEGATPLCTVILVAGTGTCTLPATVLAAGIYAAGAVPSDPITASYSGAVDFPGATGQADLTVSPAATVVTLHASPTATVYGAEDAVTYTAAVSSISNATPTGTVTFQAGAVVLCAPVTLVAGTGTCSGPPAALDASTGIGVTATYGGTADFTASTSAPASLVVRAAPTTTSLLISAPAVLYGNEQTIVYTATVVSSTSGTPTGTVAVTAGTASVCTVTLNNGTGTCSSANSALPVATPPYSVLATYQGSTDFVASTSASQNLAVSQATTTTGTAVSITPATVAYGDEQIAVYGVTITPQFGGVPTGTATVTSGTVRLCTVNLSGGTGTCTGPATLLPAAGNPYPITASYPGDGNFNASVSTTQVITVDQASTTTTLTLSTPTVPYGIEQALSVAATVTPQFGGIASGTVTVEDGGTVLCTMTLSPVSNGSAGTCAPAATVLAAGNAWSLSAVYNGDPNFASSTSPSQAFRVTPVPSATGLTVSSARVPFGAEAQAVYTATVSPSTSGVPTGSVAIVTGSTTLCTLALVDATGQCTGGASALPVAAASNPVTATYGGDADFVGSTSTPVPLSVTAGASALTVTSSANPSNPGRVVTFTTTVAGAGGSTNVPTGSVVFSGGATVLCAAAPVVNTVATCAATLPVTPTQSISVAYSGDANFVGSAASYTQNVRHGYWTVANDGGVFAFGDAQFYGSMAGRALNKPIVSMTASPDAGGYWMVASDGGIFNFGDAGFYGSTGAMVLNKPVVGMEPTPDGKGYWLVASDGGIFNYGDAGFFGSTGNFIVSSPVVGMVPTADGRGYWEVTSSGSVYAFGDALFEGAGSGTGGQIVGLAPTPDGAGYWLVSSTGAVFAFGDAQFYGSLGGTALGAPIVGVGSTFDGGGYWLAAADGGIFAFGDAVYDGSMGGTPLTAPMVAVSDM